MEVMIHRYNGGGEGGGGWGEGKFILWLYPMSHSFQGFLSRPSRDERPSSKDMG